MKILITGSKGQLGNEFQELAETFPQFSFLFTDVGELDITNEPDVKSFLADNKPDVVINCAAYTAVDKAELDEPAAFAINATAVGNLARAASVAKALLIHISTDYVFDGRAFSPYMETDITNPQSAYARSKYAGEQSIYRHSDCAVIIRTSWLYSAFGNNFVKTILKYGEERGLLNVVSDQIGTPTYAKDLAGAILTILPQAIRSNGINVYHYSNEGVASWYDFAEAIVEISGIKCKVNPIESKEYPLPATRPFYSVLNKSKIKAAFSIEIPYWRDNVAQCLLRIRQKNN